MMSDDRADDRLRRKIIKVSAIAGGVAAAGVFVPIAATMIIRKQLPAEGDHVDVDLARLAPGQMITVDWLGKPIWILHRTAAMLATLSVVREALADPDSERSSQPDYCRNEQRSLTPEFFVAVGLCTHLGCAPIPRFRPGADEGMPADWAGGFLCPCHTSTFDLAGRAFKNREARENLLVPPYRLLADRRLRIGQHHGEG